MQCNDVVHQLAARTDDQIPSALADHLADCPACSEWAKRASQLDRLWDATRAPDPNPQAWESMWNRIVESLDSSSPMRVVHPGVSVGEPVLQPSSSPRYRQRSFAAVVSLGLAQAAAVLFIISIAWQSMPSSQKPQVAKRPAPHATITPPVDAALAAVDIEEGSLVLIRSEGEKPEPEVLILASEGSPFGIDEWLLMFNKMEAMAPNPVVAMKE